MKAVSHLADLLVIIGILAVPSLQDDGVCDPSVPVTEADLYRFLFTNYTKEVRPRRNVSLSVEVTVSLRVSAIHELLERENTLVLDGSLLLWWADDNLAWNGVFPYNCISDLVVPHGTTWLPDVSLMNSPSGMYSLMLAPGFTIWLYNDGSVQYAPGGQIISKCEVDVTYFPFDTQACFMHYESWNYAEPLQRFVLDSSHPLVKVDHSWTENNQWLIEANYSKVISITNSNNPNTTFSHVTFVLVLRRKALFYYVNIIAPSIIISVVELATFVLPIEEVIKIHISFTCLLAYSVFQGMVIADLPRSGDSVPLLSLYIDLQMAYLGIIALMGEAVVFLVIRKAELKKHLPPRWLFRIFVVISKIIRVDYHVEFTLSSDDPSLSKGSSMVLPSITNQLPMISPANLQDTQYRRSYSSEKPPIKLDPASQVLSAKEKIRHKWLFIAEVIERMNMLLYIAAITATPAVMFNFLPKESFDESKLN